MADVYFTWFGPPARANKRVEGVAGEVRPDLFGIKLMSEHTFKNTPPPVFKFCCLKEHVAAFRPDLPSYVDIVPIEDQFSSSSFHSIAMSRPDLENLDVCVDFIIRETIKWRGNRGLPFKKLAFVKDLWSLYAMWKFGGYHLDCGCYPANASPVDLPDPTTFGVAAISPKGSATLPHAKVRFTTGTPMCACISGGVAGVLGGMVLAGLRKELGTSALTRSVDVWLLRSPAGHKAAKVALELYIQGWFAIQAKTDLSDDLIAQACRELAVTAVMTGVTHSGTSGAGCGNANLWESHMIEAQRMPKMTVPSMNIIKVGFLSHA